MDVSNFSLFIADAMPLDNCIFFFPNWVLKPISVLRSQFNGYKKPLENDISHGKSMFFSYWLVCVCVCTFIRLWYKMCFSLWDCSGVGCAIVGEGGSASCRLCFIAASGIELFFFCKLIETQPYIELFNT